MKKALFILGIISFLFLKTNAKPSKQQAIDTLFIEGVLIKKPSINTNENSSKNNFDYYLVSENIENFVKLPAGKYKAKELDKYLNKTVLYAVELSERSWDEKDTKTTKSKNDNYCVILKIIEN